MQDPFFAVKEEVEHSVTVVDQLYSKWLHLRSDSKKADECEWTSSELLSGLRSIEWDLQDLEDTVSIVESSPEKFQVGAEELRARKEFIDSTRQRINSMRDDLEGKGQAGSSGYSTQGTPGSALPGSAKAKGYGQVEMTMLQAEEAESRPLQPVSSTAGDEILGAEEVGYPMGGSPPMRHKYKKICIGCTLLILVVVIIAGMMAPARSPPPPAPAPAPVAVGPAHKGPAKADAPKAGAPKAIAHSATPTHGAAPKNATGHHRQLAAAPVRRPPRRPRPRPEDESHQ